MQEVRVYVVTRSGAGHNRERKKSPKLGKSPLQKQAKKEETFSQKIKAAYSAYPWFSQEVNVTEFSQDEERLWITKDGKIAISNNDEIQSHIFYELHNSGGAGHGRIAKTTELWSDANSGGQGYARMLLSMLAAANYANATRPVPRWLVACYNPCPSQNVIGAVSL